MLGQSLHESNVVIRTPHHPHTIPAALFGSILFKKKILHLWVI